MSLRLPSEEYRLLCLKVMLRDGYKCRNPRCQLRNNLSAHHIIFRSEQGPDETWNLVTLCNDCHSEVHDYKLHIYVPPDGYVGKGGGADGRLIFL